MASEASGKVQDYKQTIIIAAKSLIIKDMPEKIIELNELLKTPQFLGYGQESQAQSSRLSTGPVPCNARICNMITLLKPIIKQIVIDLNVLKMGITFLKPKIQQENRFEISELILDEIRTVENKSKKYMEEICEYFAKRGRLVSNIVKNPNIIDYRLSVDQLDDGENFNLWLHMSAIINDYAKLHDNIVEKMEQLKFEGGLN